MIARSLAFIVTGLICLSAAAAAQPLGNGYSATEIAADGGPNSSGVWDHSVTDMNNFGQVLVNDALIALGVGFADENKRIILQPQTTFADGGEIFTAVQTTASGVTGSGAAVIVSAGFSPSQPLLTYFVTYFDAVRRVGTCPVGIFRCDWQEFRVRQRTALPPTAAGEQRPVLDSLNVTTGDFAFVTLQNRDEIFRIRNGALSRVISIDDVPAQFWDQRFFEGFNDEFERDFTTLQQELKIFNDGHIAFIARNNATSTDHVFEVDLSGRLTLLYSLPLSVASNAAINEKREIAYWCNSCSQGSGVYFENAGGARKVQDLSTVGTVVQELAINDLGQILFSERTSDIFALRLYDPAQDRVIPIATNEPPPFPGDTSQFYTVNGLDSWAFNEQGQIAVALTIPSNQAFLARQFLRFDPPGTSRATPLLPNQTCAPGRFCFRQQALANCGRSSGGPVPCWRYYDPVVAIGYDYEAKSAGTRFKAVELPPIGDGAFDLFLWDTARLAYIDSGVNLEADAAYDFTANGFPDGLERFSIRGIETSANVDPDNPLAFVTALGFANVGEHDFEMIPVRFDTDATAPSVSITSPKNGATLYASRFPAEVNVRLSVGSDPLAAISALSLSVNETPVAVSVNPFTTTGGCAASATSQFRTCSATGATAALTRPVGALAPGALRLAATATGQGALTGFSSATVRIEFTPPPDTAMAFIRKQFKTMTSACRSQIVATVSERHATSLYGVVPGPYDNFRVQSDVISLKTELGC